MVKKFFFLLFFILSLNAACVKAASLDFEAQKIAQSHINIIELKPGEVVKVWVTFKNIGSRYWSTDGQNKVVLRTTSGQSSKFKTDNWYDDNMPLMINPATYVYPGDTTSLNFDLKAPEQLGLQWEKFNLYAGPYLIAGSEFEVPIKVISSETPVSPPAPTPQPPAPTPQPEKKYWQTISSEIKIKENKKMSEPIIRVGLLSIELSEKTKYLPLEISSRNNALYNIYDQNNKLLIRNTNGEKIKIDFDYDKLRYFINDAKSNRLLMTDSLLKFYSDNEEIIFKIENWKNGPFWGEDVNDNEYLRKIEIQYNPSTQRLWLINELPLEKYLEGVAEAGDSAHQEFQKAQAVAAKTYALFRINNPKYTNTPNGLPIFDLLSTQADQVYRGVKKAERAPNFKNAVAQTRGIVITYENTPILAYYFAQSDGKTRASNLARMTSGPVSYLIERIDPPGEGKTLLGHGVGLPQRSAISAASEGANYSQILKYYYFGAELSKFY